MSEGDTEVESTVEGQKPKKKKKKKKIIQAAV